MNEMEKTWEDKLKETERIHMVGSVFVSSYCASAQVLWPEALVLCRVLPCVCPCVHLESLLTRCLAEYLTHFHQTYISNTLLDRDERFTIWG